MKKICLLSTGGTIVSIQGKNGLQPAADGASLLSSVPELGEIADIDFIDLLNLDSSNIHPCHWQEMARTVAKNRMRYDGFIITHGTDTMAYSSAALYYMLENIDCPVVFTGSQLPLGTPDSDAPSNLMFAALAAASGHCGVFLAFGTRLIHGNAARKLYAENLSAFHSINRPNAAVLQNGTIHWEYSPIPPSAPFVLHDRLDESVSVLKLVPGTKPCLLKFLVDQGCHAVIIEGFGMGGMPVGKAKNDFLPMLEYAKEHGTKIICTTQCVYDGVHLDRYEVGALSKKAGAISGGSLTTEALLAKTMTELADSKE